MKRHDGAFDHLNNEKHLKVKLTATTKELKASSARYAKVVPESTMVPWPLVVVKTVGLMGNI